MFDIHQSVYDEHGEHDEEKGVDYIDGLMEAFADSEEAKPIIEEYGEVYWTATLLRFGLDYMGCTAAEMTVPDFQEIVFTLFPRKLSTEPENAPAMIAEFRAFWSFVQTRYQLANAAAILKSLDAGAANRLQKRMSDPAYFGMAKSFFMQGKQAGYDMESQEGLDRFLIDYNSQLAGGSAPLPPVPMPLTYFFGGAPGDSAPNRKERRQKRKAQRQARKRNRR
jgi:hypothetical protein